MHFKLTSIGISISQSSLNLQNTQILQEEIKHQ